VPATTEPSAGAWLAGQTPPSLKTAFAALAVVEASLVLGQAALIAAICHQALVRQSWPDIGGPAALLGVLLVRALLLATRGWLAADASAKMRLALRRRLLDTVRRQGPVAAPPTGRLLAAFDDQIEKLDPYFSRYLPQQFGAAIVPLFVLIAVFLVDWVAGLFLLFSAPLIPVFMVLIGMGAESRSRAQVDALGRLGGWFLDRLRGAPTLRRFRAESSTAETVAARTEELRQASMHVLKLAFLSSAVLEFFSAIAIAAVAIYVGMGLLGFLDFGPAAQLTLASGLFVLLLAPEFFAPLRALSQGWHDRADARASVGEISALLDGIGPGSSPTAAPAGDPEAQSDAASDATSCIPSSCAVAVDGLTFTHPGQGRALFDDLSLQIQPGERVVLVGPSGGGKSSLIDLLAGFLSPDAGTIRLDGRRTHGGSEMERAAWVAWLGQRPVLFEGSLYDNIALGWRTAERAQVAAIAETAGVMEFANRLAGGLDAPVGEAGHRLSGGQLQRVALARALLRPRPLILLDEPTAHLDPDAEQSVLDALERLLADRPSTVIIASHRPGVLARADRVLRVEQGVLREGRAE
jgi:ATP-binding cassette subfamily C protein CydD